MSSKKAEIKNREAKTKKGLAPPRQQGTHVNGAKIAKTRGFVDDFVAARNGGLDGMKKTLEGLKNYLSDPKRKPSSRVVDFYNKAVHQYQQAITAGIGMPTYSDSVTIQHEAPKDIPTLPLDGYQLVQRVCLVEKLASLGTTAGGFYANLVPGDLVPFTTGKYFRVRKVTSWTGTTYGSVGSSFAGVQVPVSTGTEGTEVMPIWSENWTPVGQGFPGIVTQYPLGDFPQIDNTSAIAILSHFTSLGGTGGVTNVPVIFHVEIECLI
jgi:hypothetical protein